MKCWDSMIVFRWQRAHEELLPGVEDAAEDAVGRPDPGAAQEHKEAERRTVSPRSRTPLKRSSWQSGLTICYFHELTSI